MYVKQFCEDGNARFRLVGAASQKELEERCQSAIFFQSPANW